MPPADDPATDDPDDVAALARHASALVDALDRHLAPWVVGLVVDRHRQWAGRVPPEVETAARDAGVERRSGSRPAP